MDKLLLLGAGEYQLRMIQELQAMGVYIIAVDMNPHADGKAIANKFIAADIKDKNLVLHLAKENEVKAVMPVNDFGVRSAAFAAKHLNLIGLSEAAAEAANNKFAMRTIWANARLPQPSFLRAFSYDEFINAINKLGYPVIVKPTDCGGGSRGISKINSESGVMTSFQNALTHADNNELILEECMAGMEITVEGICYNNNVKILAISDKEHFPSNSYCVASSLNYFADLPQYLIKKIESLAVAAVRSLAIDNSPFHMEMMIVDCTPFLIEIGARGGGGHISSTIVYLVTGVNYIQQYANILLGRQVEIEPLVKRGSVFRFLHCHPGRIAKISYSEDINKIEGVVDFKLLKKEGDIVPILSMDNERIGFVVTSANNRDEAIAIADRVERAINIVITN